MVMKPFARKPVAPRLELDLIQIADVSLPLHFPIESADGLVYLPPQLARQSRRIAQTIVWYG
jgi:hypothetical protein